ncbi:unnamed protein product [Penicillium nalgiovense]|nr:unnamed protein product [Penicillium nalgiovense]
MSFQKPEKDFGEGPKVHKIRITLTSRKVASLEKVCQELIDRARSKSLQVKGPVRLPTKTLQISTRKTPTVRVPRPGTSTRCASTSVSSSDLLAPTETVKQIIINIEAGVEVEVTIAA